MRRETKSSAKKDRTPTFVCEVPLRVTRKQEKVLLARFEAGRQMYNALLGEALRRLNLVRQSVWYTKAKRTPKDRTEERNVHFQAARAAHGFSEYSLSQYATKLRKSWLREHIGAHVAQKLAKRAYEAANRVALGKARKARFKGKRGLHSLEGKSNDANIRWRDGRVLWDGLELPMVRGAGKDLVIAHGLRHRVKYVRLVRRRIRGRWRFYAQLVCEGSPYRKPDRKIGDEVVGLDIGPSTVGVVGETKAMLEMLCEPVVRNHAAIRRLQRKIDRQRRANNPDCYDEQGRAIKGKRPVNKSRRQQETEAKLAELFRREAAHRKGLHGNLINRILEIGRHIRCEKISYRALQKAFGRSVGVRAPGKFIRGLARKAGSAGGTFEEFPTQTTVLSQVCHCGRREKKPLRQRVHECECGVVMQRDLYSAYLARFVEGGGLQATKAATAWSGAEPLLRAAWSQATGNQPASGRRKPISFGKCPALVRSRSGLSEKGSLPKHEAQDDVAEPSARACESAEV